MRPFLPSLARQRRLCAVLLVASVAAVLGLTVMPLSSQDRGTWVWWCLLCGELGLADAVANVALFVPLAIALRCSGVSSRRTVAMGLLFSATIEFVQLRVVPGRDATLGDVAWNTAGAVLGVVLAWWFPARRVSLARGLAAAACVLLVFAGTGLVLRPGLLGTTYYGQWTADLGMYEWYRGRVLSADLGGLPLPSRRLADSRATRQRFLRGDTLRIRGIAGPRTSRLAPLFSILDGQQQEILLVGLDGRDLVLHVRTHAADLRLGQPDLRWRGPLAAVVPGDLLSVEVRRAARGYCLVLDAMERCGLAWTAGQGWELVTAIRGLPVAVRAVLDCVWMVLLGVPVGLVTGRGRSLRVVAVAVLGGAVAVPWLAGLAPTPVLQLAALGLGVVIAALVPTVALGTPSPGRSQGFHPGNVAATIGHRSSETLDQGTGAPGRGHT